MDGEPGQGDKETMKRSCEDCSAEYTCHVSYPYKICPACLADLEDMGIDPSDKQPADKGDYSPRYNGMKPFETK